MRIGIFGGSFDPLHYGHLILAESAREQLQLDRVLLIIAAQSPLKPHGPVASDQARLEMLRLALGDAPGLEASDLELRRGGVSFTLETVQQLKQLHSGDELFFIAGSDQLAALSNWHKPEQISQLATWAFVHRGGEPPLDWSWLAPFTNDEQLHAAKASQLQMPALEISSGDLRSRIASGRSIRFRTPRAIEAYIHSHGLYRPLPP